MDLLCLYDLNLFWSDYWEVVREVSGFEEHNSLNMRAVSCLWCRPPTAIVVFLPLLSLIAAKVGARGQTNIEYVLLLPSLNAPFKNNCPADFADFSRGR